MVINCGLSDWWKVVVFFVAYSGVEYWLGKTSKTKSASVVELVILGSTLLITLVLAKIRRKPNE